MNLFGAIGGVEAVIGIWPVTDGKPPSFIPYNEGLRRNISTGLKTRNFHPYFVRIQPFVDEFCGLTDGHLEKSVRVLSDVFTR